MGHLDTTSPKDFFSLEPELNKDPIITPQKLDIKNSITCFMNPKPKMLGSIPFPSSRGIDDVSPQQKCKKTQNGIENNETRCGKNQAECYIVQDVHLKKLETTTGRMEIGEGEPILISPLHF